MSISLQTFRVSNRLLRLIEVAGKKLGMTNTEIIRIGLEDGIPLLDKTMKDSSQFPAMLKAQRTVSHEHIVTVRLDESQVNLARKLATDYSHRTRTRITLSWVLRSAIETGLIAMGEGKEAPKAPDSKTKDDQFLSACKEGDLDTVIDLYPTVTDEVFDTAFQIASNERDGDLFLELLDMGQEPPAEIKDSIEKDESHPFFPILNSFKDIYDGEHLGLANLIDDIKWATLRRGNFARRHEQKQALDYGKDLCLSVGLTKFEAESQIFMDAMFEILDVYPWEERCQNGFPNEKVKQCLFLTLSKTNLANLCLDDFTSEMAMDDMEFVSSNIAYTLRIYNVDGYNLDRATKMLLFAGQDILAYGEPEKVPFSHDGHFQGWDQMKMTISRIHQNEWKTI